MTLITYLTSIYNSKDYYTKRKAEYSVVLIFISIIAMITIMIIEGIIVSYTLFKLVSSIIFILGFIVLLALIKYGYFELAVNLLIVASLIRSMMIYFYPTPFQFYVMGILSMLTVAVIHVKRYQIICVDTAYFIMYALKIPVMKQLVDNGTLHYRAFSQSIYALIIFFAVLLMLYYLTFIINREINESETLIKHATTDGLTRLFNRRKITQLYNDYLIKNHEIGVIIMDIDHFKHINDTFGHQIGDDILVELADLFRDVINLSDVARWGGEEFLLLCPNKTIHHTAEVAELIRNTVEAHSFSSDIAVTISLGVASNEGHKSIIEVIRHADAALYKAKNSGRNQMVIAN